MEDISTRTRLIIGDEGVEKLRNARVVVAGCGAVGGYALEGLVRAGVGHIRVVDGDVFSESNLNRQILATKDTIGMRKVDAACQRARSINPDIDIEGLPLLVSEDTLPTILDGGLDVAVDAIDTVRHKIEYLRAATAKGLPIFSSMGAAMHRDPQKLRVATLRKTSVCPMAAMVRKGMRDLDTRNMTCVYSIEQPASVPEERDSKGKSVLGSLPTVPAVSGMTVASLAIEHILSHRCQLPARN